MSIFEHFGFVLIAGSLLAVGAPSQTVPTIAAPCTVAPQPLPCGSAPVAKPVKPPSVDPFAFPSERSAPSSSSAPPAPSTSPAEPESPVPQPSNSAAGTSAQTGAAGKGASGLDFPDEDPKPLNTSGAGSSSSSSSSSSNPDTATDPDANSDAAPKDKASATPGRHLLHRVNPIGTKLQNTGDREAEDLDVARFYTQTGDLQGAYLRSQDAVKIAPEDPDAHFALAEIARKLNKRDEAIAEYNACLKFDPTDKETKSARKEIARLKQ